MPTDAPSSSHSVINLSVMLAEHNRAAGDLAFADAESFRQEGPRIDNRIGTLVTLVLGALASSGLIGGVGASVSRQRHAYVAMGLLATAAVVIMVGLMLIVRLILPKLDKTVTGRSGALARVAALPDADAARAHYQAAAGNCLTYQAMLAWTHAVGIARRFYRFRTAGRVLIAGVLLAGVGFLALTGGW